MRTTFAVIFVALLALSGKAIAAEAVHDLNSVYGGKLRITVSTDDQGKVTAVSATLPGIAQENAGTAPKVELTRSTGPKLSADGAFTAEAWCGEFKDPQSGKPKMFKASLPDRQGNPQLVAVAAEFEVLLTTTKDFPTQSIKFAGVGQAILFKDDSGSKKTAVGEAPPKIQDPPEGGMKNPEFDQLKKSPTAPFSGESWTTSADGYGGFPDHPGVAMGTQLKDRVCRTQRKDFATFLYARDPGDTAEPPATVSAYAVVKWGYKLTACVPDLTFTITRQEASITYYDEGGFDSLFAILQGLLKNEKTKTSVKKFGT